MPRNIKRIVTGKIGLDSHDNGIRIVSKWYMDHGYEVIYAGLYNTCEHIVQIAVEESADALGVSFLGAGHLHYGRELSSLVKERGLNDLRLIIGGVIPPVDVKKLVDMGFHAIFTPGTRRREILDVTDRILNF